VQHAGHTNPRAHAFGIGRDSRHRFGGCLEQQAIDRFLVQIGDPGDLGWHREDHVEIFHRQQILGAGLHPVPRRQTLAFGAVPVLAGVVGDVMVTAFGTASHVPAERLGSAGLNGRHHLELGEADMPLIGLPPRRAAMGKEDVSDLQLRAGHWLRALFQPSSQGLILQQLHLFERADRAADRLGRYMGVARRGRQLGVPQQYELMRWMPPPNGINCAKMVLL
jgi:hypothetical protein